MGRVQPEWSAGQFGLNEYPISPCKPDFSMTLTWCSSTTLRMAGRMMTAIATNWRLARELCSIWAAVTGRFAAALAPGREVFGVDPQSDVDDGAAKGRRLCCHLDRGRRAECLALGDTLSSSVLTGHTFQVFLTDEDQRAVCDTIAAHLAPGGTFILDSASLPVKSGGSGSQATRCDQSNILRSDVSKPGMM